VRNAHLRTFPSWERGREFSEKTFAIRVAAPPLEAPGAGHAACGSGEDLHRIEVWVDTHPLPRCSVPVTPRQPARWFLVSGSGYAEGTLSGRRGALIR
jgi:hypothetical protein